MIVERYGACLGRLHAMVLSPSARPRLKIVVLSSDLVAGETARRQTKKACSRAVGTKSQQKKMLCQSAVALHLHAWQPALMVNLSIYGVHSWVGEELRLAQIQ